MKNSIILAIIGSIATFIFGFLRGSKKESEKRINEIKEENKVVINNLLENENIKKEVDSMDFSDGDDFLYSSVQKRRKNNINK